MIETKHPNDRGREVEERVAAMLTEFRWDRPGAPVRLLSFSVKAIKRFGWLLPALERTFLVEDDLGRWRSGKLPDGVAVVGPDLALIKGRSRFRAQVAEERSSSTRSGRSMSLTTSDSAGILG